MSKRRRTATRTASEPMGRPGTLWQRALAMGDPKLGCEIGRLHFDHKMTATEVQAAAKVAEIYGRYERMAGLKRACRSPSYEVGYGGGGETAANDRDEHIGMTWHELQDQIPQIPIGLRTWLEQLVVEDRHLDAPQLEEVRALLKELAKFYSGPSGARTSKPKRRVPVSQVSPDTKRTQSKFDRQCLHEAALQLGIKLESDQLDKLYERTLTLKFIKQHRSESVHGVDRKS